ncbi:hypothetical protein GCM10010123_10960 [Pilimelia anulata]|uniref:DUF2334 domain-containing protein n=1 Tax=Pilimelia anulata TaxID=53371 RepID=A0A8J3B572_9ACTN|nr:polysaccharide deacetylase family protein [Pilimelia anulata]GGJ83135.1 hypothetical protein GCM10010123_10960 [Pilimelia anulata]
MSAIAARLRRALAAALVLVLSGGAVGPVALASVARTVLDRPGAAPAAVADAVLGDGVPGARGGRTLVLYDRTGPYGWMGETYGIQAANLVSHFGPWAAKPAASYRAGELARSAALVYIGSTYDEPLPAQLLADIRASTRPVLWISSNIWQLSRMPGFAADHGFVDQAADRTPVTGVRYGGRTLTRDPANGAGITSLRITDPARATVLAEAVRSDGSTTPWAVRSGNLTYVGEIPFAFAGHDDRYLALADLLFELLAPRTAPRHRALVRIEDVGPDADPAELRAIADYLHAQAVPFSVAVYARYRDPRGAQNKGRPQDYTLADRPEVVAALRYLTARGGTLLMHGYTHQYAARPTPYDGSSGNDFEFYLAHVDDKDSVILDGPVPDDSPEFARQRIAAARDVFARTGLPQPTIFEFPHYAGSPTNYRTVQAEFGRRYERSLYAPGVLSGRPDFTRPVGQFFPYPVRDVYGSVVVPENIGNIEPGAYNHHPVRLPADLIASAERNLVVRDGVASFFYHPFLGVDHLAATVSGIKALGYTFVPADAMVESAVSADAN